MDRCPHTLYRASFSFHQFLVVWMNNPFWQSEDKAPVMARASTAFRSSGNISFMVVDKDLQIFGKEHPNIHFQLICKWTTMNMFLPA